MKEGVTCVHRPWGWPSKVQKHKSEWLRKLTGKKNQPVPIKKRYRAPEKMDIKLERHLGVPEELRGLESKTENKFPNERR